MKHDFCTFELAIKLKEKGFNWRIGYAYGNKGEYIYTVTEYDVDYIPAPTISQVLKWLRNTHNLHVETYPCGLGMWKFLVTNITTLEERALCDKYTSSEQSALAGIEYVFDNLI